MEKLLKQIEKYILIVTVFLLPITVLSISPNAFTVPKLAVLVLGISFALLVRAVRIIVSGKLEFSVGSYDLPVFLVLLAYILSAVLKTPNKMEALLLPGTATIFIGASLLYYLINQFEKEKGQFILWMLISGAVFSLITIFAFTGVLAKIPQLPAFMRNTAFTPEGGFLPAVLFLASLVPLGIGLFTKSKKINPKLTIGSAGMLIILGLGISLYSLFPGRPTAPRFPSLGTSWSIAVDSLKDSPVLGVGPGNYLTAFNRFRPVSYNATDLWAVKFATAGNFYLTVLTEAGLLGFAAVMLLLWAVYKRTREKLTAIQSSRVSFKKIYRSISLILLLLLIFFYPASFMPTVMIFVLLSLSTKAAPTSLPLLTQSEVKGKTVASRIPALIVTVPLIAGVIVLSFYTLRFLRGEYMFKKSIDALAQNQVNETLTRMQGAVNANPRVDRYRITISRVYLTLANSVIQNAVQEAGEGGQVELSDQERVNITQLIQGSIAEAKNAVALNPLRAGNWEVLASTYRSIMPLAQGADAFAVQTYSQAVALDPINPNLRISLGGIYYAVGDFESAVRVFERAVAIKPDHANAHYNLAFAYREQGQLDKAINEMSRVLSFITDTTSRDYQVAQAALEAMQTQREQLETQAGQELTPPEEGEQVLEPPLDLPEDAEPPESPISPTPTPTEGEESEEDEDTTGTVTPSPTNSPTPRP